MLTSTYKGLKIYEANWVNQILSIAKSYTQCALLTYLFAFLISPLQSQEHLTLLNQAAVIFQKEKLEMKNYRVKQEVTSTVKESSGKVVEKRNQIGYYKSPNEYIFVCKEIELNDIKQILSKPLIERTNKTEADWLSKEGMQTHTFQLLSTDSNIIKYLVSPIKIQAGSYRGQIWIIRQTAKIKKIIKEPVIKKKEVMRYFIELNFENNYLFQIPSKTHLNAVYQVNSRTTEVNVEATFKDYLFNKDFSQELQK